MRVRVYMPRLQFECNIFCLCSLVFKEFYAIRPPAFLWHVWGLGEFASVSHKPLHKGALWTRWHFHSIVSESRISDLCPRPGMAGQPWDGTIEWVEGSPCIPLLSGKRQGYEDSLFGTGKTAGFKGWGSKARSLPRKVWTLNSKPPKKKNYSPGNFAGMSQIPGVFKNVVQKQLLLLFRPLCQCFVGQVWRQSFFWLPGKEEMGSLLAYLKAGKGMLARLSVFGPRHLPQPKVGVAQCFACFARNEGT